AAAQHRVDGAHGAPRSALAGIDRVAGRDLRVRERTRPGAGGGAAQAGRVHGGGEADGGSRRAARARCGVPRASAGVLLAGVIFVAPTGRIAWWGKLPEYFSVYHGTLAEMFGCRSRAGMPDSAHI